MVWKCFDDDAGEEVEHLNGTFLEVLERHVPVRKSALNQLTKYTTRQNCLTKHQNEKKHSTETRHIFMSDMILEAMDRKQVTALVLLDLSKPFDSIEHGILLRKL